MRKRSKSENRPNLRSGWFYYGSYYLRNFFTQLQCLAKTWIYLTPYICAEWTFDSRPFIHNKIFLKKLLKQFVANIFTLLLAPFASLLVNYSQHSESLNIWKNPEIQLTTFSFDSSDFSTFNYTSKTHCPSNNWPINIKP